MNLYDRYTEYYKPLLRQFCKEITDKYPPEAFANIPHPFIPSWGTRYEMSLVKMAVIGKETAGWSPDLPEYISHIRNEDWNSSFDISEFQNLDYVKWTDGHRYTFWGFVMYFLAALYGVKNWEILKQRHFPNILNSFVWGNASAIECEKSVGPDVNKSALQCARQAAYSLNDYQHIQKLFSPNVSIIMCARPECDYYLRNTEKKLMWDQNLVRLWKLPKGDIVFNMPHPNRMRWDKGADFYAQIIRQGLMEHGLFQPMQGFIDCDRESEEILHTFFSKCKQNAKTTREAVAFIATELRKQQATMTVRMLCNILNQLGYKTTYGSIYKAGRGSYRMISCAWDYYKAQNPDIAESIATAFTLPNGNYAYE